MSEDFLQFLLFFEMVHVELILQMTLQNIQVISEHFCHEKETLKNILLTTSEYLY